jgi:pimeloyl-ACP methyl ester carboxylesterase
LEGCREDLEFVCVFSLNLLTPHKPPANALYRFKQYIVTIEGTNIHYIYEKSTKKDAIPLLLLHGWGSTVSEFNKVIEPLVNPPAGQQAFDVIAPSLPGIGYSSVVQKVNATVVDNARIFNTLMTEVLGYKTYVAQGGDFGAINLRQLQTKHADTMKLAYAFIFL